MIQKKIIYTTSDGKTFEDKKEAEKHERKLQIELIKIYRVQYHPTWVLNAEYKDTGCKYIIRYEHIGYVYIHANSHHGLFLQDYLCETFGNPISFVMGVHGSNEIMESYTYSECSEKEVEKNKILARIEEEFVDKLWS